MQLVYRLIARFIAKRPHLVDRIRIRAYRTPYSHITSRDGYDRYMGRYWLFNAYENRDGQHIKRNWFMRLLPSIRIHEIELPDDDEHMHDHPWNAQTLILRGGYVEEREDLYPEVDPYPGSDPDTIRLFRHPGDTAKVRFGEYHRVVHLCGGGPTVTLFITFKYRGEWGFKVDGKKVPWRDYFAMKG